MDLTKALGIINIMMQQIMFTIKEIYLPI
jgi:hypothetical protein